MNPPQVYMCSPSWTLLPPPSPYHPTGSSQCTSPKHPVSCIEPGLATRFIHDILHVFVLIINVKSTPKFRGLSHVPFSCWQFRWLRIWARITRGSRTPLCVMSAGMAPRGLKDPRWLHACVWDLAGGFWLCASLPFHRVCKRAKMETARPFKA